MSGSLYIVATPIGNLDDITKRAISILEQVDLIAAEDTRHSRKLLNHLGINNNIIAYFEHNEEKLTSNLIEKLIGGMSIRRRSKEWQDLMLKGAPHDEQPWH